MPLPPSSELAHLSVLCQLALNLPHKCFVPLDFLFGAIGIKMRSVCCGVLA